MSLTPMRLAHPLAHRLRRLLRLSDHHVFYENREGVMKAGCGLCLQFLAELIIEQSDEPGEV